MPNAHAPQVNWMMRSRNACADRQRLKVVNLKCLIRHVKYPERRALAWMMMMSKRNKPNDVDGSRKSVLSADQMFNVWVSHTSLVISGVRKRWNVQFWPRQSHHCSCQWMRSSPRGSRISISAEKGTSRILSLKRRKLYKSAFPLNLAWKLRTCAAPAESAPAGLPDFRRKSPQLPFCATWVPRSSQVLRWTGWVTSFTVFYSSRFSTWTH